MVFYWKKSVIIEKRDAYTSLFSETVKKVFLTVSPTKCKHLVGDCSPLQRTDFVSKIRTFVGREEFFARRMSVQKMS